MILSFTGECCL